jgi:hypothetical protein
MLRTRSASPDRGITQVLQTRASPLGTFNVGQYFSAQLLGMA